MYYCFNCGHPNEVKPAFCPNCGTALGGGIPLTGVSVETSVPEKSKAGRHWPAVLAMILIFSAGVILFCLSKSLPVTPSTDSQSCFSIENGQLYFHAEYYSGGSSLTVPDTVDGESVTALGNQCFSNCDSLTEIILPEGLLIVGEKAFAGCDALRGIYIPETVEQIKAYAFKDCTELEAISIPSSVVSIDSGAFSGCEDLRYIFYDGTVDSWSMLYSEFINDDIWLHTTDGDWYYSNP